MKQILIVEDDELLNKMLVYNLQSESYGIVSVETVKEAMEVLKSQQFDLVLLDINLPDGNGYAIAKTIREKYCDTIVIFLTANDRESDEIRGYELGAVDYKTFFNSFPTEKSRKCTAYDAASCIYAGCL